MLYLLQALPEWAIAATVIGLLAGLFAPRAGSSASWTIWSVLVAILYAVGAVAAALNGLPGRYGFWLETALLLATAYFVGYATGGLLRRLFGGFRASRENAASEAQDIVQPGQADRLQSGPEQAEAPAVAAPAEEKRVGAAPPLAGTRPEIEDDLRLIRGLDEKTAQVLRDLGIRRFAEVAGLTPDLEQRLAEIIPDCGPEKRRFWTAQAQLLAGGVETDFSLAARLGETDNLPPFGAPLDEAAAESLRVALPQVIAPHARDELYAGLRPLSLLHPPQGEKDDLSRIAGIDPSTEERLNALGIWTYAQIARWSDQNVRWIGFYLAFPGRIEHENWVGQAQVLAANCNVGA